MKEFYKINKKAEQFTIRNTVSELALAWVFKDKSWLLVRILNAEKNIMSRLHCTTLQQHCFSPVVK